MQSLSGEPWAYEDLNEWLTSPSSYLRGTTMAFAGISRDDERASVIAYLASQSPNAPAFPEPLPEDEATPANGEAVDASLDAETVEEAPATATGEIDTVDAVDDTSNEEGNAGEVELAPEETTPE